MGNKKARNEALLAALTKFMAWTERTPQQEDEAAALKEKLSKVKHTLDQLHTGVCYTQNSIFQNYTNTFNTFKELLEEAIKDCTV